MEAIILRRLEALDYPHISSYINDKESKRSLIAWLEDRKIRLYKVEDRPALRSGDHSAYEKVRMIRHYILTIVIC